MTEQSNLQRVFETILSSQSYELLASFAHDDTWEALSFDEKDLLAQLFLLSAEANSQAGNSEDIRTRSIEAYKTACRLVPTSARNWYRLGAYQALGLQQSDISEAIDALKKAVELDERIFDAHYALGCAKLRLGSLQNDDMLLASADTSFEKAEALVSAPEGALTPIDFYWHWGIVWFLRSKFSGEPIDLKRCLDLFERAQLRGLGRPNFLNDYGNAIVEMALLTSNDTIILDAIALYSSAIEASGTSKEEHYERGIRLFNVGCCYQHLYNLSYEKPYFEKAQHSFSEAALISPELSVIWQRWGLLLFQEFRFSPNIVVAQEAVQKFSMAEEKGGGNALTFALSAEALLWMGRELEQYELLSQAEQLSIRAMALEGDEKSPEVWAASTLCQYEYGFYFQDRKYFSSALQILQKGLAQHPKSALLWHILALVKVAEYDTTDSEQALKEALVSYHLASRSTYAKVPSFWNDWGIALLSLADETDNPTIVQEAIAKLEVAKSLDPRVSAPWIYNLARAFDVLGTITDDEEPLQIALQLLSEMLHENQDSALILQQYATTLFHLAEIRGGQEDFLSAIHAFERYFAVETEDEFAFADYALSLMYLGEAQKDSQETPKEWFLAEEALLKSLALGNDQADYYLASLYSLMGNFSDSMQHLEKAFDRRALPPLQTIFEDNWLEPLAKTVVFNLFIQKVKALSRPEDQYFLTEDS